MRYVSFVGPDGRKSFGSLHGDEIVDLGGGNITLKQALAASTLAQLSSGNRFALSSTELLPVIPDPGKILCVGLNYATHIAETGREKLPYPAIFTRWADTLVAHGAALQKPNASERFDYEGELAVIIGKAGHKISRARALAHVAGYAVFNDGSVRDWQRHNSQFTPGKNFPATAGFGPGLVTPDEIPDLGSQRVQTRVNGALVQDQPVSDMIWDVATIIEYCSAFTPLSPGDVIATGTPGGVGDKRMPPLYMQPGDTVEISIGAVGTLRNSVIAEPR